MHDKIKGLFFDLDGTLVDMCETHYAALNRALKEVAGVQISRAEHTTFFDGLSTRQKMAMLVEQGRLPDADAVCGTINELKQRYTQEMARIHVLPKPEITEACQRAAKKYTLACVSNCVRSSVEYLLGLAGLTSLFGITISNEDVAYPKPSPEPYLKALSLAGLMPSEAIAVEDNGKGEASARAAGVACIRVEYAILTPDFLNAALRELGAPQI